MGKINGKEKEQEKREREKEEVAETVFIAFGVWTGKNGRFGKKPFEFTKIELTQYKCSIQMHVYKYMLQNVYNW